MAQYKWLKIGTILSFIPFILVSGPLGGYFLAEYLERRFAFPFYTLPICIIIGFVCSAWEVIKMIKFVLRYDKNSNG